MQGGYGIRVGEMHQHHFVVQREGEVEEEVQCEPEALGVEILVFRKISPEACQGRFRLEFAGGESARCHDGK